MNHLWLPVSPCGAGCLPHGGPATRPAASGPPAGATWPAASGPPAGLVRGARLVALAAVLFGGFALLPLALTGRGRTWLTRAWAGAALAALGIRLSVRGVPPRRRALLVANHVSWLDALALFAVVPGAVLLAKREVRSWPVIGVLARAAGTLFVDRSRPRALPGTVAAVDRALRGGTVVAGFPEGTTWCGRAAGGFRPALFQAAIDAGVPVVPVALSYRSRGEPTTATAFVGGDTLWTSLCRVAAASGLAVRVEVTSSLHPAPDADRRALAGAAAAAIHAALPFTRVIPHPPSLPRRLAHAS